MVDANEPQDYCDAKEPQDYCAGGQDDPAMWDPHDQTRFTLVWSDSAESVVARRIVVRSLYATFRGQQSPRTEPASGFQLHRLSLHGVDYFRVMWRDARDCKLRLLRLQLFEEYKLAVAEQRIRSRPASSFSFQMDSVMQGLPQQHITGKEMPFALDFAGGLDQLGAWIQQFD